MFRDAVWHEASIALCWLRPPRREAALLRVERFQFLVRLVAEWLRRSSRGSPRSTAMRLANTCIPATSRRRARSPACGEASPGPLARAGRSGRTGRAQVLERTGRESEETLAGTEGRAREPPRGASSATRCRIAWSSERAGGVFPSPSASTRRWCGAFSRYGGCDVRTFYPRLSTYPSLRRVGCTRRRWPRTWHPPHRADRDREGHALASHAVGGALRHPFGDQSGRADLPLSRRAREHVKVALSARGDELFSRFLPLRLVALSRASGFALAPGVRAPLRREALAARAAHRHGLGPRAGPWRPSARRNGSRRVREAGTSFSRSDRATLRPPRDVVLDAVELSSLLGRHRETRDGPLDDLA